MADDAPLLTTGQVAEMLGRDRSNVWRIKDEALPYLMKGKHRRYRIEDVRAYMRATTPSPDLEQRLTDLEQRVTRLESRSD